MNKDNLNLGDEIPEGVKRRGKKRDKYIPSSEPLELPFCRVCGKRASGIHFGVYSCEACKVLVAYVLYAVILDKAFRGQKQQIAA
jgi:ribosomal protein L37AE/L43A